MTDFFDMTRFEEGWRQRPYLCSEGYPTAGFGFKLGPKCSQAELKKFFDFELPLAAGEVWMACLAHDLIDSIKRDHLMKEAYEACLEADKTSDPFTSPRASVLLSMCYQMGVEGVAKFRQTLKFMSTKAWSNAAPEMLKSVWASQTPDRAKRHSEQIRTGQWAKEYPDA